MNERGYIYCENAPDRELVEARGEEWTPALEKQWRFHVDNIRDNFAEIVRRYVKTNYEEWPTGTDRFGGTVVGCHKDDLSRALRCTICGGWVRVDPMAAAWERERCRPDPYIFPGGSLLGRETCTCVPPCEHLAEHYSRDGELYPVWSIEYLGLKRKGDPSGEIVMR